MTRTRLRGCGCTPWILNAGAVFHSAQCPDAPNQGLTTAERNVWIVQNQKADAEEKLRVAMLAHPAKGTKQPLRTVRDPDYVNAHSDDLDDREELER
jgi:hypothetical protein